MTGTPRTRLIQTLGPGQHRECTCPHPRCFSNDEGRCNRCGYPPHQARTSTSRLRDALAHLFTRA